MPYLLPVLFALAAALPDVIFGLEGSNWSQWQRWFAQISTDRTEQLQDAQIDLSIYQDPHTRWNDASSRQMFLFIYDTSFIDHGVYQTESWLEKARARFGRIDSVLLWQAYPQLGFDQRNQFDFYEDMPGGLAGVRKNVSDVFHRHGVRVFVDYNPWDEGASDAGLARVVGALDADGVMLDTLAGVPSSLKTAIDAVKKGVVLAPERRPEDSQLGQVQQSWAQWYDTTDNRPSIYRQQWLVPGHRQLAIRRWDTDRLHDIAYSFFNGSGLLLWDQVFGTWNPYSPGDQLLISQTSVVLGKYSDLITHGKWQPLIPSGSVGLDVNHWSDSGRDLYTLRNRTEGVLEFEVPTSPLHASFEAFWPDPTRVSPGQRIPVAPGSVQALVADSPDTLDTLAREFTRATLASQNATRELPQYHAVTPTPRAVIPSDSVSGNRAPSARMIPLPGGEFTMTISHTKRESGCYPFGADSNAQWGWFFQDVVTHKIASRVAPFSMKATAVTNTEFLAFVRATRYEPLHSSRFLAQIPRNADGSLSDQLSRNLSLQPVTYVSLDDARAYARWKGERVPTEAEWQWAAEGAGLGRAWPWGDDAGLAGDPSFVNLTGSLAAADSYERGATAQGLLQMTGNAWELTESEYTDDHTRYVMLRGGSYLAPAASEWIIQRGPRDNHFHAKYFLSAGGLERSGTISFRTVK